MRMKKIKLLVACVVTIFGVMSSSVISFAETTNTPPPSNGEYEDIDAQSLASLEELSELSRKTTAITDTSKIEQLKTETLAAIKSGEVKETHETGNLDFNQVNLVSINEKNKNFLALSIPVMNGDYSYLSNLTVLFDDTNKIIMYSESLVSNGENNYFKFDNYVNGILYESKQSEINYLSDSELREGVANLNKAGQDLIELQQKQRIPGQPQTRDLGKTAICLAAVFGIGRTAALVIAGMCVGSCPAVPLICAACIGAAATVGVGGMAAAVECFKL